MKISGGDQTSKSTTHKIEFTKTEEVAEMGEYARKEEVNLPFYFKMDDEGMMKQVFAYAEKFMKENNFDTFVIHKETFEEFVYFMEE